ncbi:MAG: hypothetical protein QNK89_02560 [Lacinutrix sp.]
MKYILIILILFSISSYSKDCKYEEYYKLVDLAEKQSNKKEYKF